jgi:hypothetical protein
MKSNLSPELIIARLIKSATNGRIISVRLRRILTLIIFPIWVIGLSLAIYLLVQASSALSERDEVTNDIRIYEGKARTQKDLEWAYNERVFSLQKEQSTLDTTIFHGFASVFYFIILCFLLPWLILRITFWIIDADKVKEKVAE